MIYLDNAATTQIHPEVLEAMMPYLKNEYGNAGTLYSLGRSSAQAIDKARKSVAELIGAKPNQIVFTSGGSEANSMVFNGVKNYLKEIGKTHIVASQIEHDSVLKAAKNLIKDGFYITYLKVDSNGRVDIEELKGLVEKKRLELVQAAKEKKMFETLKEKKFEEYREAMNRREQQDIDELITFRNRKKD